MKVLIVCGTVFYVINVFNADMGKQPNKSR